MSRKEKIIAVLVAFFPLWVILLTGLNHPAQASTLVEWTGNGAENLPCDSGGHWVLSPAQGITAATLTVNGVEYAMTQNGSGSFAADSSGSLSTDGTTASATYDGENDKAFIKLSHCTEGGTPSPSPSESPSPSNSPSPSPSDTPTPSPSQSETPTPSTPPTSPPGSHTHTPSQTHSTHTTAPSGSDHAKRKTAYTGFPTNAAVIGGLLLVAGLGALYLTRKGVKDPS